MIYSRSWHGEPNMLDVVSQLIPYVQPAALCIFSPYDLLAGYSCIQILFIIVAILVCSILVLVKYKRK